MWSIVFPCTCSHYRVYDPVYECKRILFVDMNMMKIAWFKTGLVGSVTTGLCCVTGLLPFVLASIGLSGVIGYVYRDSVLFPLLAVFLVMMGYGIWRKKQKQSN